MNGSDDDGLSPVAKAYRAAAPWLSAVWQFVGSMLVGVGGGYAVDRWAWSHGPIGLLVGVLGGVALGFFAFFRAVNRLMSKETKL